MQPRAPENCLIIDTSHWNNINWSQVAAHRFPDGRRVTGNIGKTSDTHPNMPNGIDWTFEPNYYAAKEKGLKFSAYHYGRAQSIDEAKREAELFLAVVQKVGGAPALDFLPALDWEDPSLVGNGQNNVPIIHAFMQEVYAEYRFYPMLYSYPWFMQQCFNWSLAIYPLWYAYRAGDTPADTLGWHKWQMLQYSTTAKVNGVQGYCDVSEFAGKESDLMFVMPQDTFDYLDKYIHDEYAKAFQAGDKDKQMELHRRMNDVRLAAGKEPTAPL